MSIKTKLTAAALGTLVAMSAAAGNAHTFSLHICDGAVSMRACGSHMAYLETLRVRHGDTSRQGMQNTDPRYNQALRDAGGGGGGGR
jgi:hypothetical protein